MALVRHVVCACALLALSRSPALAQDMFPADTTLFRRGQWAAQFAVSSGYASLGVLRFTTPTRAWLLDARVSGGHSDAEVSRTKPDTTVESFDSDASVTLRVGRRFYSNTSDRVFGLHALGVSGGFSHSAGGQGGSSGESNAWNVGFFFELGGNYLVTRRLSFGAIGAASIAYSRSVSRGSTGARSEASRYGGSLGGVSLVATLYF